MKLWVGTTDNEWFNYLAALQPDEVNFWQPSSRAPFTGLPPGTPFLFKVKAPHNHLAGGGYFLRYETLPLSVAWDAFGPKNGSDTFTGFARMIRALASKDSAADPVIGCTMLGAPFFLPRAEWLPAPASWSRNIVVGKTYDSASEDGEALLNFFKARSRALTGGAPATRDIGNGPRFGEPVLVTPRWGQGIFRASVTAAYGKQCAITGETTLPTLEAAHIRPYRLNGPHAINNGLLLRADFHKLFDRGLVTVTPELKVVISERIKDQWYNGKAYYRLQGESLRRVPDALADRPDPAHLRWHNENVFERLAS